MALREEGLHFQGLKKKNKEAIRKEYKHLSIIGTSFICNDLLNPQNNPLK